MKKLKGKSSQKINEMEAQKTTAEFSAINQKREKELQEMDRIAKMLIRRDFELAQIREKREKELEQLRKLAEERAIALIRENAAKRDAERKAKELTEKTKELQEKIDELEKFQKLTIGREITMIALKQEIKRLKKKLKSQENKGRNKK